MQLSEFQNRFKNLMLDHPDALDTPPEDLAAFCAEGDIPLPDRLKVYRNNIIGSLTDVMVGSFPFMEKLVGREFLELMSRSFILENPPSQGCLSFYGEGFADFIQSFELAKSLPYLPDIARFELAENEAYYADDDEALSPDALASIAPEALADLKLELRASAHLLHSQYPLITLREFCMREQDDGQFNMDQGGVYVMITRPQLETVSVELSEDEFRMLQNLQSGKPLGASVEAVIEEYSDFGFQEFLQKHINLETFKALPPNS